MAEKPVVQIVLPPMPNPKDFGVTDNPTANGGMWQIALNAWRDVSMAAVQALPDMATYPESAAVPVPVRVIRTDAPPAPAEPLVKPDPDLTKN